MAYNTKRLLAVAITAVLALSAALFLFHRASTPSPTLPGYEKAILLYVVDGDTLFVKMETGEEGYIRLIGIDCPESVNPDEERNTPEGKAASDFTKSIVTPGQPLWLSRDVSDTDKFGRWLRFVWLDLPDDPRDLEEVREKMLQGIILDAGHAVAKRYTPDTSYAALFERI